MGRRRPFILLVGLFITFGGILELISSFEHVEIGVRQILFAMAVIIQDSMLVTQENPLFRFKSD